MSGSAMLSATRAIHADDPDLPSFWTLSFEVAIFQ